ncbi:APC family permease [Olivibacter sp. XZL3]|uniref:APC family permease n=1 Tax=Olivibacter sp. XZL3 TaxID=1735116 RepID=UPI00106496D1|nr:amino acid permease [Olivibacter sp. XZL3]
MPQKSVDNSYKSYEPKKTLGTLDAVALIVGIVIGAGVFKTPSLVALHTNSDIIFLLTWLLGGAVSLIGALSYAELCAAYPHTGGDYHFLYRAYGRPLAFLFAWTRMVVIQTGSIALLAFIFGDYATQFYAIGPYSQGIYALAIVIILTFINVLGLTFGATAQKLFTLLEVGGILLIICVGLFFTPSSGTSSLPLQSNSSLSSSLGMAMVFVLLTFGGWNEAAYISAELKTGATGIAKALIWSILIITLVYVLVNYTYIHVLGHERMASSEAVAADLMRLVWGEQAAKLIGLLVAISALTSANATIITGARSNYALGQDFASFKGLGQWNHRTSSPVRAMLIQGLIAVVLVVLGLLTRKGFETIVDYTAPVFWFFFLLIGIAVFVLRKKDPQTPRPFKVPFYPVLPALFCISSLLLLYSSLVYTGIGALVGVLVVLLGFIVFVFLRR